MYRANEITIHEWLKIVNYIHLFNAKDISTRRLHLVNPQNVYIQRFVGTAICRSGGCICTTLELSQTKLHFLRYMLSVSR